jgi:GAF domain-containing protein
MLEGKPVQIPDVLADAEYKLIEAQKLGGWRATLAVPLLRDGQPIGALALVHTAPRPFTERQIELITTFADQAVIAIENTRLRDLYPGAASKAADLGGERPLPSIAHSDG